LRASQEIDQVIATMMALALQAQPASLPPPDGALPKATVDLMRCVGAVAAVRGQPVDPVQTSAHLYYYLVLAAQSAPTDKPLMKRVDELTATARSYFPEAGQAQAIMEACDKAHPVAKEGLAGTLPANAFERDFMCLTAIQLDIGAADEYRQSTGDATYVDKLQPLLLRFRARMTKAAFAANHIDSIAAVDKAQNRAMAESVKIGNLASLLKLCDDAAPPSSLRP
jgi:hypothetical protein